MAVLGCAGAGAAAVAAAAGAAAAARVMNVRRPATCGAKLRQVIVAYSFHLNVSKQKSKQALGAHGATAVYARDCPPRPSPMPVPQHGQERAAGFHATFV